MKTTLQTATGRGVASLWARVDRFNRRVSERPMELAWHRPSPLVVMHDRTSRSDMTMNVTASLRLAWNQTVLGRDQQAPPPTVTVMRPAVVTPRLETRIERERLESRLVPSATPAPSPPVAPVVPPPADRQPTAVPTSATPAVPTTRVPMAAPRVQMVLAPAPQTVAANAVAAATRTIDGRNHTPAQHASASVPPEMRIDRITTEVVRVLDSRLLAFRERMGDR